MDEGDPLFPDLLGNGTMSNNLTMVDDNDNCSSSPGPSAADLQWQEDFAYNVDGMLNFFTG